MTRFAIRSPSRSAALASVAVALAAPCGAACAQAVGPAVDLRPGQEVTIPVTIADGKVTPGPARVSRPGAAKPKDGEITVGFVKQGLSPYAMLTATEKTPAPVDFIATGLIGDIKIDEVKLCGRLDATSSTRIASGSWRVALSRFSVGEGLEACR
jgi:hypothetical protein